MQLQQAQQQVVPIVYVGKKDFKVDNVNHTNTVWAKPGDVQPYPLNLAAALLRHRAVWKLGKATDLEPPKVQTDPDAIRAAGEANKGPETNGDITKNTGGMQTETMADAAREGPSVAATKSQRTLE